MSEVRFVLSDETCIDYAFGDFRAPIKGEQVVAEGDDPLFPAGVYEVTNVNHNVCLRGPRQTVCALRLIYALPRESRTGKRPS